ncbi:unnamed protein product [Mytilus coruscus]|uniref:Uncharacterized protein n=1 Tax=Mytilus coruscus TaxID=42192 RepID=A0A6J8BI66_MYTCO|nr:unnamed protein product [Mytilus coruscus]
MRKRKICHQLLKKKQRISKHGQGSAVKVAPQRVRDSSTSNHGNIYSDNEEEEDLQSIVKEETDDQPTWTRKCSKSYSLEITMVIFILTMRKRKICHQLLKKKQRIKHGQGSAVKVAPQRVRDSSTSNHGNIYSDNEEEEDLQSIVKEETEDQPTWTRKCITMVIFILTMRKRKICHQLLKKKQRISQHGQGSAVKVAPQRVRYSSTSNHGNIYSDNEEEEDLQSSVKEETEDQPTWTRKCSKNFSPESKIFIS